MRSRPTKTTDSDRPVRLLVSVRNVEEADAAVDGGADLVDVKEPANGPMGMAGLQVIDQIASRVAGRRPLSAALGELIDDIDVAVLPTSLQYIKIALAQAPADWRVRLARCFEAAKPAQSVAVAYADHDRATAPSVDEVLDWACCPTHGAEPAALLVDTSVKDGAGLFDWLDEQRVADCIDQAHEAGLLVALAGSLGGSTFEKATRLGADIVAVRGAACIGSDRRQRIDVDRVCDLAAVIAAHNGQAADLAG